MGKIVSIHSYRGGTGKSNLTANLATAVALTGKRVGVVDTDIQSPGIHILFGLDDKQITRTLNDYLYGRCNIEDTAAHVPIPEVAAAGGRVYLIRADRTVLTALDHRAEFDETYKAVAAAPGDPYANARDFYLQRRQAEIDGLHGHGRAGAGGMSAPPAGTSSGTR